MLRVSCNFVADGGKTGSGFEFGLAPSFLGASLRYAHPGRRDGQKPRICSKWSPWSAGCGSWSCEPVRASRLGEALAKTEDLSKPEWCFERCLQFGQNLEELAHGVRPGHADILVLEHEEIAIPRPGLCLPRSAQVQLGQCLRADFSRSAHIALVMQRKRAAHQQLVSSRKRVKNESEESWMALL